MTDRYAKFHNHVFLGEGHERNERRTWTVIALCGFMMVAEIVGGYLFGSIALIAGFLGFWQLHDTGMLIARVLCFLFLAIFVVSLLVGTRAPEA